MQRRLEVWGRAFHTVLIKALLFKLQICPRARIKLNLIWRILPAQASAEAEFHIIGA